MDEAVARGWPPDPAPSTYYNIIVRYVCENFTTDMYAVVPSLSSLLVTVHQRLIAVSFPPTTLGLRCHFMLNWRS